MLKKHFTVRLEISTGTKTVLK